MPPSLRDFTGQSLQWKRPRFFSTTYNLHAENQILATISRDGTRRAKASAEEQQWIFQREGQRKFLIYPDPGGSQATNKPVQPLATFQSAWNRNGNLTFHDGRSYSWTRNGNWRPRWSWQDTADQTLLTVKKSRLLEFAPATSVSPDLALLALFALYLILTMEDDDTVIAAISIGSFS